MQHHDLLQRKVTDPGKECVTTTAIFSATRKAFLLQPGAQLSAMLHRGFWAALHASRAWTNPVGGRPRCLFVAASDMHATMLTKSSASKLKHVMHQAGVATLTKLLCYAASNAGQWPTDKQHMQSVNLSACLLTNQPICAPCLCAHHPTDTHCMCSPAHAAMSWRMEQRLNISETEVEDMHVWQCGTAVMYLRGGHVGLASVRTLSTSFKATWR